MKKRVNSAGWLITVELVEVTKLCSCCLLSFFFVEIQYKNAVKIISLIPCQWDFKKDNAMVIKSAWAQSGVKIYNYDF